MLHRLFFFAVALITLCVSCINCYYGGVWFENHPYRKYLVLGAAALVLIAALLLLRGVFGQISFSVPRTNYVPVYTLVSDKVSQHGAVIVNLPKGVSKEGAKEKISFDPPIRGEWVSSSFPDAVVFKPADALALGKHYEVALAAEKGTIRKDFLVDEDPAVVEVFPSGDAEADRSSAITIVFNRPMVPLTALSELENKGVPVKISPETKGKFKWISTRTLQFIPDGFLAGSAHYTVTILSDFTSMDGLALKEKTFKFTTAALRMTRATSENITYSQPINFYFNQPVDIDRTRSEIRVTNDSTNSNVAFVARYGQKTIYDSLTRAPKKVEDRSVISIFPDRSLNGHQFVWNFETPYTVHIQNVYPVGGDIALSGTIAGPAVQTAVLTTPLLRSVSAVSDKTGLASAALFDPAGTATFNFYEDIDTGKSVIQAKGLKKIVYGTKCEDAENAGYGAPCKKVEDRSSLTMSFDPRVFARGEQIPVLFQKLVNTAGYQVNERPITATLSVYPELRITRTTPDDGDKDASVNELILCSNVPLRAQDAAGFKKNVQANGYMVFGRWNEAYLVEKDSYEQRRPCAVGEYANRIRYGLLPQKKYSLTMSLDDVFGQKTSAKLSLQTGKPPAFYLRFQSLQKMYNVTTPEHTKLTYATENFDYVNLSICKLAPDAMLRVLAAHPSDVSASPDSSLPCSSTITKKIPLKPDQWVNQYFQVDLSDYVEDPRGQYVFSFSHPQYTDDNGKPLYARTYMSVTDLAVTEKHVALTSYNYTPNAPNTVDPATRGSVYWVNRIHSMAPEANATVRVFKAGAVNEWGDTDTDVMPVLGGSATTDARGIGELPLIADIVGATVTSGDESAVISAWADRLNGYWNNAHQDDKMYLYTDRPIYRPGQQVFIKGLYRLSFDGLYTVFRGADVSLQVRDSKGDVIQTQKLPVSAYGTVSASVTLPLDAPLGTYSLDAGNGYASFDVAEYVGAAFETSAATDKEEYTAGETAHVSVSGKYYFGVPLDGGELSYSISAQNFYFDRYADEYFSFGSGWYDCYDCGYGDTYIKSGKATLNQEGSVALDIPLGFEDLFKDKDRDQSKIFVLHGTIKDAQGKSVSFQKSFIVHRGEVYLGAKTDPSFAPAGQALALRVKTVDQQGKPVAKSGITITINKVSWTSFKRQEVDGGYYSRYEQVLTPVITKTVSTNLAGDYTEQIKIADPGQYQIDAQAKDGRGNTIKSTGYAYIYGAGTIDVRPTNNATLDITAEKKDVKVGDTARFIIQSPYPRAKALISIERGRIFTYEVVDIDRSIYEYEFPVTEDYAPNVYASVVLLSPDPAIKFGQVEFEVNRKVKELAVRVRSDKTSYLPGEKVNLTVTTADAAGQPVPAEVSIAVADLSVLALKGNPKKDPLLFFYGGLPLTITTSANIKNILEEAVIPTGTKGGDGSSPDDLAKRKRGEFRDTAFWQATVETNAQGQASVSFTLPDNLTKWQIESVGITKDTRLGVEYSELVAQKDVMALPLKPRFSVPGDEFLIGAKLFNQTKESQTLDVSLESKTLVIKDTPRVRRSVRAGETDTVYFKVLAPESITEGAHTFTLSAKNAAYDDTVEQSIPITKNSTFESVATAGVTNASSVQEYLYVPGGLLAGRGGLTVKTSATLAVYLSDALKYLFEYPYGCSEQLASKLSAIAITKQALAVPNAAPAFKEPEVIFGGKSYTPDQAVQMGLDQIYENQTEGGGFSYYKGLKPDPYLTARVVETLADIRAAGYAVRQSAVDRAVAYLYVQANVFKVKSDTDSLVAITAALSRADTNSAAFRGLASSIAARADARYMSDTASSNTLGLLALISARGGMTQEFKNRAFAALINRVDIDSRGAYVRQHEENIGWRYYETPEKNTALLIKALVADARDYSQTDKLLRWLLASRSKDGSWGSTDASVSIIGALSDYLRWKHETESEFTLDTMLDAEKISETTFGKKNILSTIETFLPIAKISPEAMHTLSFAKQNGNSLPNNFYYDLSLKYYLPAAQIAPRDEGVAVTRNFFSLTDKTNSHPLAVAKVGDIVRGVLTIVTPKDRHLFAVEDYIPAGFELVDFNLATEDRASIDPGKESDMGAGEPEAKVASAAEAEYVPAEPVADFAGIARSLAAAAGFLFGAQPTVAEDGSPLVYQKFYPDFNEQHDDRIFLFAEDVSAGAYTYEYYLRATVPGTFSHLPAVASDLYFPENFGRTSGSTFTVTQ